MADFSSLKQTIQSYIKQNGNEEITGNILQDVLLAMVSTMGDSAINSLASALQNETSARQNQDGTLQGNITAETTARQQADTALGGRIDGLQTAINGINTKLAEGYIYAGIATPSTNPGTPSGKVFYIAIQAGTYTNFGGAVVAYGINILKYNGSAWSLEQIIAIDARPKKASQNLVTSGGVFDNIGALDVSELNATENPHTLAQYADLSAALAAIPTDYQKGGMSIKFVQSSDNKYIQARCMAQNFTTDVTQWQGVDEEPIADSENLVKSGGVFANITESQNKISTKLFLCDEFGNVLADFSNGDFKTKKFSSIQVYEDIEKKAEILEAEIEAVDEKYVVETSNKPGEAKLFVVDANGNAIIEIANGAVKTKSFDSDSLPAFKNCQNNNYNICDCFGNVMLSVKGGNIITKHFNSNDVNALTVRVSELEQLSDGYASLLARNTPAISWIDDDFDTYSTERLGKLNILKAWAIDNNIKPDIALIPDVTYTDNQRTDIENVFISNERLSLALDFEYNGMNMLTHPIHYGIYGEVIKDEKYIRKDLFLSRKALLDAGFPGCDIFVYAGSSAGVAAVEKAAREYYDVAIMPGGNIKIVNLPNVQDRYRLVRFDLDSISATNTVSQIKQRIDDCIASNGWIIFITHVWMHTGDGTEPVDETSNSLANVFEIIKYANQRVNIRPTQEVWREKKILWEYYK